MDGRGLEKYFSRMRLKALELNGFLSVKIVEQLELSLSRIHVKMSPNLLRAEL